MAADSDDMSFEPPLSTTFNTAENIPATGDSNCNIEKHTTLEIEIGLKFIETLEASLKSDNKCFRLCSMP